MILTIQNAIPEPEAGVAGRIVRRTLAKRENDYASEVRRLLDAALEVMGRCGTSSRPRWPTSWPRPASPTRPSTGTSVQGRPGHRPPRGRRRAPAKLPRPPVGEGADARGPGPALGGGRARPGATETSPPPRLAVLWNGGSVGGGPAAGRHFASAPLASLLHEPFARAGQRGPRVRRLPRGARHARQALGLPVAG